MTLICRPAGRGNWTTVTITITVDSDRAAPILVRPGQTFTLGGLQLRIVQVLP